MDLPEKDPLIGREVIGQYVIRHKIGAGGMGTIYLADQTSMGRKAVIKVLHPWLSNDPEVSARFDNEAKAVARLSDPHIVQLFNYGDMGDGTLFLAMEYLDGHTLSQLLRAEGRLSVERAVNITLQICEALAESHANEVVHRDLKPSNIMLLNKAGGERVKVLDFGVAKLAGSKRTSTGQPVGTPRYMAPEQLAGNEVDGRSDLYALGLVLYEMLAGTPPFVSDTPIGYIHKHMSEPPPALEAINPEVEVPPALAGVIMKVLSKVPEERPPNATRFADELRAALRQPQAAPPAQVTTPVPPMVIIEDDDRDEEPAWARPLMAFGAIALLGGVVVLGMKLRSPTSEATTPPGVAPGDPATAQRDPATPATVKPDAQVGPPPTTVSPATDTDTGNTPLPPLSPEVTKLLELSVAELEKQFYELVDDSYIPPSSKQQVYDSYGTMARSLQGGPQAEQQRKTYLVQVIQGYQNTPRVPDGFDAPLDTLEAVFDGIESDAPLEMRRQTLEEMVKSFNENAAKSEADKEYWRRYALISLIENFSGDKGYLRQQLDKKK
jgi:serine/threonine-protein kinase